MRALGQLEGDHFAKLFAEFLQLEFKLLVRKSASIKTCSYKLVGLLAV